MMNFTNIFTITSDTIARDSVNGILEVVLMVILTPFVLELCYEKEWEELTQVLAVLGVFFAIKVITFVLPFIIQSLISIF